MYCYVEFGVSCQHGVEVEFTALDVEPYYDYTGDYYDGYPTWVRILDSFSFTRFYHLIDCSKLQDV